MSGGQYISLALVIGQGISILFLIMLSVDRHDTPAPPLLQRLGYIGIMMGLTIHVEAHIELLIGPYRPPRTWSWLIFHASVNYTIWYLYLRDALPRWFNRKAVTG